MSYLRASWDNGKMSNDSEMLTENLRIEKKKKLEYEPMPNVAVALPNIGDALCWTPQSLADAHDWSTLPI